MGRILDKAILLLLGIVMLIDSQKFAEPVVLILVAFSLAGLGIYIENRYFLWAELAGFVLLCFAKPECSYFLPLIAYDCGIKKQKAGFFSLLMIIYVFPWYENWKIVLWLIAGLLSFYLSKKTLRLETLEKEMIRLRDNSTELNLALKEKNRDLMEKQDYEIRMATLRERNRIAREIHDNVGHMLSRSILQVGALTTIYKEEPMHGQLVSVNETLNTAMNNIRESVHDLHDDSIDLKQALYEIIKPMQENYQVKLDYDMSLVVTSEIKYSFLAIVKEALSNIVKHSDADRVTILVREHPAFYQLCIEDNGTKEPKNLEGGIGLENMRHRVETLKGMFHVKYENGFKVLVTVRKEG
ncbi:MAG: sensor histidine kinase [Roseburia sp.]